MRLINFGAGEIVDRLTILSTKILYGSAARKETKHWLDERNVLLTMLRGRELNGSWFPLALDLAAVNAALWRAEDDLRGYRQDNEAGLADKAALWEDAAKCAFRCQELNDRRAELIEQINRQTGEFLGQEKLT